MSDLLMQQLSTVQNNTQPTPPNIASAGTISPTNFLNFISGSVQVINMIPFVTGPHMVVLIFTAAVPAVIPAGTAANQFKVSITPTQNVPVVCIYDPVSALWWAGVMKTS
jgi:hypothetical protein